MSGFPDLISGLPQADLPVESITGYLLQGENRQLVFFEMQAGTKLPMHSHGAQWGIVIEGEMELTIGDSTNSYRAGDSYFIPAQVMHGATFLKDTRALDIFEDADRYTTKKST